MKQQLTEYLRKALEFPREIHLESSSRCNASCLTCPRDKMNRELGELPELLFMKAIKETSDYEMDFLMLHLNGEPLMMDINQLVWRINMARDHNPKAKQINFFTNGSLLDEEKADKILQSKLDLIMISIDGGNKEDYEKIRRGLSWDTLLKNVRYLVKRKKELGSKCIIQTAIIPQKANKDSVNSYFNLFQAIGADHVGGSGVNNIGGLIDADNMKLEGQTDIEEQSELPCFKLFIDLSIMSDGRACVCAQDVTGALIVGNLWRESLKDIWQGEAMRATRENFIYGNRHLVPFCCDCDYMRGYVPPDFFKLSKEDWIDAYKEATN